MKRIFYPALIALTLALTAHGSSVSAQDEHKPANVKVAPIIIRLDAHSMNANDFQIARSKHREIEGEIRRKGVDLAFTEWMQRDHPYIFAKECIKHAGDIAVEFKSTNQMVDFENILPKRSDLRMNVDKYGSDVAFAEWLRTERPGIYRKHFGLDENNRPIKKDGPVDKMRDSR